MSSKLKALLDRGVRAPTEREREEAYAELTRLLTVLVRASMSRRLRGQRDSMDVCQSVARSFVADMRASQIRFDTEAALVAYLRRVVANKLADLARRDGAAKRGGDAHRNVPGPQAAKDSGPASAAIEREAAEHALEAISEADRQLWAMRRRGWEWERIAAELGITPAAARQRWSRLQAAAAARLNDDPAA